MLAYQLVEHSSNEGSLVEWHVSRLAEAPLQPKRKPTYLTQKAPACLTRVLGVLAIVKHGLQQDKLGD